MNIKNLSIIILLFGINSAYASTSSLLIKSAIEIGAVSSQEVIKSAIAYESAINQVIHQAQDHRLHGTDRTYLVLESLKNLEASDQAEKNQLKLELESFRGVNPLITFTFNKLLDQFDEIEATIKQSKAAVDRNDFATVIQLAKSAKTEAQDIQYFAQAHSRI